MRSFWSQCVRVLRITRKPSWDEFMMILKVSGFGILAIGLVGFLIHLVKVVLTSFGG